MRRRPGELTLIEVSILDAGIRMATSGHPEFHGFQIAEEIRERDKARLLTAYGTLYKALDRMEEAGLLVSRWENADVALQEKRPRRRFYRITSVGVQALVNAEQSRMAISAHVVPKTAAT